MKVLHFICLTIIILVAKQVNGQNYSQIDSLQRELAIAEGIAKANLYLDIAWEYRKSHPDSTIYYCDKTIDLIEQYDFKGSLLAKAINFKGVAYHYLGDNVTSFEYYNKAIDVAIEAHDSLQYAHALNSLGRIYLYQGSFLEAYERYFEALEIFKKYNDQQGLGYAYKSLSELYQTQQNYDKALEMSHKTLEIRKLTGNLYGQISILMEIAQIHQMKGEFTKAFDYYLQAKIQAESINDKINIATINLGIADLYYNDSVYAESLIFAKKAYEATEKTQNMNLVSRILLQLGKIYFQVNQFSEALGYLDRAIETSQLSKELDLLKDAYFFKSQILRKRGNYEGAYDSFQMYAELEQKLSNAEAARTIERFESRIEIEKQEQQNKLLLANQARDQAIIDRQRIQNWSLLAIAVVLLVLGIVIFITAKKRKRDNKRLNEKNHRIALQREEITSQNEQISRKNKELKKHNKDLEALNNEKNTLMNIVAHDLKSPFNRIKGLVELLKLSGPNDEQKNYIQLLDDITKGSVDLIRDLLDVNAFEEDKRKPTISKIDVHDLLLEKTKLFYADGKSKGIEIKTPSVENHLIFESDEIYISRILDNLISNAIKFSADNSQVILRAGTKNGLVFISVKDQGQGFSEEDKKHLYTKFKKLSARPTGGESSNGLGLAIVKTLVDRLGGEIELESETGKGSEFIIKFATKVIAPAPSH